MFLRFNEDGTMAEASPIQYDVQRYAWFDAPEDFTQNTVYLLQGNTVRQANSEEQQAALLQQKKQVLMQRLAILIDDKRIGTAAVLPGKEREYVYKTNLVSSYQEGALKPDSPGYVLISDEAEARGVSVEEMVSLIKAKSLSAHKQLGALAGFHVRAKGQLAESGTIEALDAKYQELLDELRQISEV